MNTQISEDIPGSERENYAETEREMLIEQIYSAIIKLPADSRNRIHKKYLERYGWVIVPE